MRGRIRLEIIDDGHLVVKLFQFELPQIFRIGTLGLPAPESEGAVLFVDAENLLNRAGVDEVREHHP